MSNVIHIDKARRELAHRSADGIEVLLYWHSKDGSVSVEVFDHSTEETLELAIAPEAALDAFYHPYAYVAAAAARRQPVLEAAA